MSRNILWIDDSQAQREAAGRMLGGIDGVRLWTAASSYDAELTTRWRCFAGKKMGGWLPSPDSGQHQTNTNQGRAWSLGNRGEPCGYHKSFVWVRPPSTPSSDMVRAGRLGSSSNQGV